MEVLYLLEKIRMPGLNELMLAVTTLGEETAFLVIGLIIFWCVDKRKGYYVMSVGFAGTMLNQIMKLYFRIPRPWVRDPNFPILEQAREAAAGYSFPSGHTQTAVGTFGCLAASTQKKWWRVVCIALAALVGFSRMYVGVHTPADVLVGAGMAVVLALAMKKPIRQGGERAMKITFAAMIALSLAFFMYVHFWNFPADLDAHNMESGMKNAYTMLGCTVGIALVYVADQKLDFSVEAVWYAQILKVVLGLLIVLAVKEGLRSPLEMFLPVYPARGVRYLLIVLTAGILWPMTFRYFSKLGVKK
jgi:undecaprenyl-diphosphatase